MNTLIERVKNGFMHSKLVHKQITHNEPLPSMNITHTIHTVHVCDRK